MPPDLTTANATFWNELCGTQLAQLVGVTGRTANDLRRFDAAYFRMYPYLAAYLETVGSRAPTLEIGLGFGTTGQALAERGVDYTGLDIAAGPVEMMRTRLDLANLPGRALRGSALELPFPNDSFQTVFTIGCLHHTGDVERGIAEVRRVLGPGGTAIVMLYNRWSWRRVSPVQLARYVKHSREYGGIGAALRANCDVNSEGDVAPHIDFVTRRDVRRLFAGFHSVKVRARNLGASKSRAANGFDRRLVDSPMERAIGQDLYIKARA